MQAFFSSAFSHTREGHCAGGKGAVDADEWDPAVPHAQKSGYFRYEFLTTDRQTTLDIDSDVDQSNLISVECNLEQNNLHRERSER
eukprot:scaffold26638_cov107-Skeletonema_marinoi.AAC.2